MESKNKVLHQNKLDSFNSYSKSTFSVSDYFENNIANKNLRNTGSSFSQSENLWNWEPASRNTSLQIKSSLSSDNDKLSTKYTNIETEEVKKLKNSIYFDETRDVGYIDENREIQTFVNALGTSKNRLDHSKHFPSQLNDIQNVSIGLSDFGVPLFDNPLVHLSYNNNKEIGNRKKISSPLKKSPYREIASPQRDTHRSYNTKDTVPIQFNGLNYSSKEKNLININSKSLKSKVRFSDNDIIDVLKEQNSSNDIQKSMQISNYDGKRIQATTRTIESPKLQRNLSPLSTPSPSSKRNTLSPAQKRALYQEKRVKLIEMRSKQLQWMTTFEKEKKDLLQEIKNLNEEKSLLEQSHLEIEKKMDKMEKKVEDFKDRDQVYQKQIEELQLQLSNLKEKLNQKETEGLQPLANEYDRLTQKLRKELSETQDQLKLKNEEFNKITKEKEDELLSTKNELILKINEISQHKESINKLEEENKELKKRQDKAVTHLQEENIRITDKLSVLKQSNDEHKHELEYLKSENRKLLKQYEDLQTTNQNLIDSEINLRHRFSKDLKDRETTITNLQREIEVALLKKDNNQISIQKDETSILINTSKLQELIYKTISNLTTIESLIPGINVYRNDDIDDYDFTALIIYLEKQSSRLCNIIRGKVEDEMSHQAEDCIIS